jgi:hypothetical protein
MKNAVLVAALLLTSWPAWAQFSTARRIVQGASLPATCAVGDVYFKNTATVGTYACTATNTWTLAGTGASLEYATVDLTAQTANVGSTTLYAVPASGAGVYRVSCYVIVTSVGTTSTLPSCVIGWTDKDNSVVQSFTLTPTNTGNTTTTFQQATMVLDGKASTNITYSTTGYASTGSAMQYAIHIKVEAL